MRKDRIDYRMRRRAVLGDVASGLRTSDDVRDAHPELLRAAAHLGEVAGDSCPLCEAALVHVTYVFDGDRFRHPGGRAVPRESLAAQLDRFGALRVYVVEVCGGCHWHHLVESYLLVARDTESSAG